MSDRVPIVPPERITSRTLLIQKKKVMLDFDRLVEFDVEQQGERWVLRTQTQGTAGTVCQAVRVALPPTIREVDLEPE